MRPQNGQAKMGDAMLIMQRFKFHGDASHKHSRGVLIRHDLGYAIMGPRLTEEVAIEISNDIQGPLFTMIVTTPNLSSAPTTFFYKL